MKRMVEVPEFKQVHCPSRLEVVGREDLAQFPCWRGAFANERKDHRYYELIDDTLHSEFDYHYFVIRDASGEVRAVQPFFLLDQDLLVGVGQRFSVLVGGIRNMWPRFMRARTLMVGCAAGEGHLDGDEAYHRGHAQLLASLITGHARALGAKLIVLKEFPARYRSALDCFLDNGFTRIPSLPMTRLCIDYASFDDYMNRALNSATRRKLRKKFQATEQAPPIGARRRSTARILRTSRRTGSRAGWLNWRLRSDRRPTGRSQSDECIYRRPTASSDRWASRACGIGSA